MPTGRFPLALARAQDQVPIGGEAEWEAVRFTEHEPMARLDLGGIVVQVRGRDPILARVLTETWGEFLIPPGGAVSGGLTIELSVRGVARLPFESPLTAAATETRGAEIVAKLRGVAARIVPAYAPASDPASDPAPDLASDPALAGAGRRACALVETVEPREGLAILLRLLLWAFAQEQGVHLLHAAAVLHQGEAVLFVGPAHSGKSTACRLSLPRRVLTDDAVLLRLVGPRLLASTAGFWGAEGSQGLDPVRRRETLPVAACFVLEQAPENRAERLGRARAALALSCAIGLLGEDTRARSRALAFAEEATRGAPVFQLRFQHRDGSFWDEIGCALASGAQHGK